MSDSDSSFPKPRRRVPGFGAVIGTPLMESDGFHLKRTSARLLLEGDAGAGEGLEVRLLLNDFRLNGASLFIPRRIEVGSQAKLVIQEPMGIEVSGLLTWLEEGKPSRSVMSALSFHYRCGFEFRPPAGELTERLAEFCKLIEASYPGNKRAS